MSKSIVNSVPYPFQLQPSLAGKSGRTGQIQDVSAMLENVRGKIPSIQASRLRTMILSSRLVEEARFLMIFLAGYPVAGTYDLPDTGYIAKAEMYDKIQEAVRQVSVPVMADGDTGYGSPLDVRRTVESYAHAAAAGIMIED
ncbi:Fc.00g034630.m01.CDS01 [Cosmosporella sp. VM-42]